jgi:Tfp pilus assembly protein PilV
MRTFPSHIRPADRPSQAPGRAAAQDGFTLIEVITSALMIGLIVVGTFSGFEAADSSTTQDRLQNEAAVLAAQSQDQLRSTPASALETLATAPHTYTKEFDKVNFTIKQEARFVGGEGTEGCSVTQHKNQISNALRITSTVSWARAIAKAAPVVETGVVTPPTGSALEVDVGNAPAPTAGVADVTVLVKYTAVGTSSVSTLEATTTSSGCIVFGAIPATAATVEIPEQGGFVTPSGSQYIAPKEETLAPNTTTYDPVTYNRGGAIIAKFEYEQKPKYKTTNNKGETEEQPVKSDTFVVLNADMHAEPDYEVGSTRGELLGTGLYEPLPGVATTLPTPATYETEATSPTSSRYPEGNLFPFPESEGEGRWVAFAGDCKANDPEELKVSGVTLERKWITSATTDNEFKVPLSHLSLNVYKGTEKEVAALGSEAVKNLETTTKRLVTITDSTCASATAPNNETTVKTEHTQYTTTTEATGGHLEYPFQPFGSYKLCVYNEPSKKTYTVTGEDLTTAGSLQNVFLAQRSTQEREEAKKTEEAAEKATEEKRKTEETQAREKREKEEAPAREKREKEEATEKTTREKEEAAQTKWETEEASQKTTRTSEEAAKATRLAKEKTERETWATEEKAQEKKGKHLKPDLAEKEKTQETSRKSTEATEKTAEEKRKTEEAATKSTRTKEEAAKATREKEEATTAATRKKEEEAKTAAAKKEEETWNARKSEEATKKSERIAREALEAKEGAKVTVESGKAACA